MFVTFILSALNDWAEFILLHAKLQLPSSTIVNVTADGVISRVGLMLPPCEALCSAREGSLSCALSCALLQNVIL